MNILQVVSMGYVCGGAEKSVVTLRDGLQARGHKVKILSSDRDPTVPHFSDYQCAHISGPLGIVRHLWNHGAYRALKYAIRDFKPDVVHFHTMGELSPSVLFALGGTPALLTVHGPEEYTKSILQWYLPPTAFNGAVSTKNFTALGRAYYTFFTYLQRPLYAIGFRRLSLMLSPSKYLAGVLRRESFGVPIKHVYNGIELPAQQPLGTAPNLLYVGRLEQVKGVDVLLHAMQAVVKSNPAARLRIVGDGPDKTRLHTLARELGLGQTVTFCGWLKGNAVVAEYANAQALVIPSVWPENLPTVAIEALAVGRPIIGSRVGGIPELVQDGATGTIVEAGNAHALAAAIINLLHDPQLTPKANAAHASAARFSLEPFITNIETIYKGIKK